MTAATRMAGDRRERLRVVRRRFRIRLHLLVADGATGWMYNGTTGEFIINCTTVSKDGATTYDQF